jgi:hypothetical protein
VASKGPKGLRGGAAAALILLLTARAEAVEWSGRLMLTASGSEVQNDHSGQNRQFLELSTRGPVFLRNRGTLSIAFERLTPLEGGAGVIRPLGRLDLEGGFYRFQVRHRPKQPASLARNESSLSETHVNLSLNQPGLPTLRLQSFAGRREDEGAPGHRLLSEQRIDLTHSLDWVHGSAGYRRARSEDTSAETSIRTEQLRLDGGFQPRLPRPLRLALDGGASRDMSRRQDGRRGENRLYNYTSQAGYAPRGNLDISGQHALRIADSRASTSGDFHRSGEQSLLGRVFWRPLAPVSLLAERESRLPVGEGALYEAARAQAVVEGNVAPLVHLRAQYLRSFHIAGGEGAPRDWWTLVGDARLFRGMEFRSDVGLTRDGGSGDQTREQYELRTRPTSFVRFDAIGRIERRGPDLSALTPSLYLVRGEAQYVAPRGPRPTFVWENRYAPRTGRRDRFLTGNIDLLSTGGTTLSLNANRATGLGGGLPATQMLSAGVRASLRLQGGAVVSGAYHLTHRRGLPEQRDFSAALEWRF